MPRHTVKYRGAITIARQLGIPSPGGDQEQLYRVLNEYGWYWNSHCSVWSEAPAPQPASESIRVRVWAASSCVEAIAEQIIDMLVESNYYELIEKSEVYPCRPPNQKDSRIYLTFLPPES